MGVREGGIDPLGVVEGSIGGDIVRITKNGAAACRFRIFTCARTGSTGAAIEIQFKPLTCARSLNSSRSRPTVTRLFIGSVEITYSGSLEATRAKLGATAGTEKTRPSASLFFAADTFLGPAYFAYGRALSGDQPWSFYLMLGVP